MADEEWKKRLNDPGYKNWLKVSLALIQSKEALHDFTKNVIDALHNNMKTEVLKVCTGICTGTSACNTRKKGGGVGGKVPTCPNCANWVTEIKKHNKGQLLWKNADPMKWHNDPWEIAKCFMNAQGNKATAAAVTGPDKTDLSGMLNVLINCEEFRLNHIKKIDLATEVREVRNKLMHCATMSFKEAEMKDMIDHVIAFLEDEKELKHLVICKDTVKNIKSLKDNEFELKDTDEHACIETALAAASGEDELAKDMMSKLCELIKGNKDLEMKFEDEVSKLDAKIMNMKQEYDAKFSKIDFNFGELKGQIEDLANKVASGQSFSSNATSSVIGNEIKSYYKNMLQSYAQRKKLAVPKYESNPCENKFLGTVLFNGKKFKSSEPKPTRKEAEQSAAEEALKFLGNEDSEECDDKNEPPSTELQNTESTQQESKNCKGLLQEKSQKQKINKPIYNSTKTDDGFVSEVMYNGRWFSPDMSPQNKKVDAEQKAAQYALAALDRAADLSSEKKEIQKKDPTRDETDFGTLRNNSSEITGATSGAGKTCNAKSKLNEYSQRNGAKPPYYEEIPVSDNSKSFRSKVTVLDKTFECDGSYSTKKMAEQMAAAEAIKYFDSLSGDNSSATSATHSSAISPKENIPCEISSNETSLLSAEIPAAREVCKKPENSTRVANLNSSEERTTNEPTSDETEIGTPQKDLTEVTGATSPDGKTYKSKLNEYAQREGAKPYYEEIPSDDGKGFRSKVTVLGKTFVCRGSYSNKKNSEQMAAAEAMEYFNGLSGNSSATPSAPPDNDDASLGKNEEQKNMTCEMSSNNTEILSEIAEARLEQASGVETAKQTSGTKVSDNLDRQQVSTPKPQLNFKNALQEYVEKRMSGQALRYEKTRNPTKMFVSKVFVGKRCFRGKDPKPKLKEAEKHVAEVALNILEGRDSTPDPNCKELLKEYHNSIGVPTFPKYEEACGVNDGRFNVEVKVKKKYKFECEDAKPKKKDVGDWLAEQAVKVLEKENKISPAEGNPKSRLNLFFQSEGGIPEYDFQGDQAKFTGSLCFYAVDVYESLAPQQTKEEATAFAAMSACNGMDLL